MVGEKEPGAEGVFACRESGIGHSVSPPYKYV